MNTCKGSPNAMRSTMSENSACPIPRGMQGYTPQLATVPHSRSRKLAPATRAARPRFSRTPQIRAHLREREFEPTPVTLLSTLQGLWCDAPVTVCSCVRRRACKRVVDPSLDLLESGLQLVLVCLVCLVASCPWQASSCMLHE